MISAVSWVPRGAAKAVPVVGEPTEEELRAMRDQAELLGSSDEEDEGREDASEANEMEDDEDEEEEEEEEGAGSDPVKRAAEVARALTGKAPKAGSAGGGDLADELAELDMEHYDDEEDAAGLRIFGNGGLGAAYYKVPDDDPYLTSKADEEDEEEVDDFTIRPTDLLILTARNEDDVSHIEVWVCEEGRGSEDPEVNAYVHHDIMLPAFPLALAWMDCNIKTPSAAEKGNLVAVGTMEPAIEIWDLDVVDSVEPVAVLGGVEAAAAEGADKKGKTKTKKKKTKKKEALVLKEGSHADAVLGLAWNAEFRNVLASGSADRTVKVWDVATLSCQHTLTHHSDKVQAVAWNPREPTVLLSGSFDRTAAVVDLRAPEHEPLRWGLSADVECLAWDPHAAHCFVVSTEDGLVRCHDVRKGGSSTAGSAGDGAALYTLHAHDKATCAVSFNVAVPNLLATASTDKMVKLWDTEDGRPSCIASTNPKVGALFSLAFSADSPFLLAMGGSKGTLHVWDTLSNTAVARRFGPGRTEAVP